MVHKKAAIRRKQ